MNNTYKLSINTGKWKTYSSADNKTEIRIEKKKINDIIVEIKASAYQESNTSIKLLSEFSVPVTATDDEIFEEAVKQLREQSSLTIKELSTRINTYATILNKLI